MARLNKIFYVKYQYCKIISHGHNIGKLFTFEKVSTIF